MRTKITRDAVTAFLKAHDEDPDDVFRVELGQEGLTLYKYRRYTTGPRKGEIMLDRPHGGSPHVQIVRKAYAVD